MTTITLPPDVEEAFAQEARQTGTTTEAVVLGNLRAKFTRQEQSPEPEIPPGATMLDFLKDYIGAVASSSSAAGQGTMSVNPGEAFAQGMMESRHADGSCRRVPDRSGGESRGADDLNLGQRLHALGSADLIVLFS